MKFFILSIFIFVTHGSNAQIKSKVDDYEKKICHTWVFYNAAKKQGQIDVHPSEISSTITFYNNKKVNISMFKNEKGRWDFNSSTRELNIYTKDEKMTWEIIKITDDILEYRETKSKLTRFLVKQQVTSKSIKQKLTAEP